MRGVLLFLVLALALAGCSKPGPDAAGTDDGAPPSSLSAPKSPSGEGAGAVPNGSAPQPYHEVFHQSGFMGMEVANSLYGPTDPDTYNETMDFLVRKDAVAIIVELAWADTKADLDLFILSPGNCPYSATQPAKLLPCIINGYYGDPSGTGVWREDGGVPGQGDSPARVSVTADEWEPFWCSGARCDFEAITWVKASTGTDFDFYASVFYGEPPAEGYSAIPQAGPTSPSP